MQESDFAAIASDNPEFEVCPPPAPDEVQHFGMRHGTIIGLWEMLLGEMSRLDAWAACASEQSYKFFFSSAPLSKLGGASPPDALAIK